MSGKVESRGCLQSYVDNIHNKAVGKLNTHLSCLGVERFNINRTDGDKKDGWISTTFKILALIALAIPFTVLHLLLSLWDKVTCCCKKDVKPGSPEDEAAKKAAAETKAAEAKAAEAKAAEAKAAEAKAAEAKAAEAKAAEAKAAEAKAAEAKAAEAKAAEAKAAEAKAAEAKAAADAAAKDKPVEGAADTKATGTEPA